MQRSLIFKIHDQIFLHQLLLLLHYFGLAVENFKTGLSCRTPGYNIVKKMWLK